ncbi:hypothetical protein IGS75_13820 (plasmid) [Gluconobacter sphaericus]|uniref:hypothetical protein n=1 Tax=Gluconobacter sphaericus TaxID=574987 RepID=UPI00192133D2|nr:hypothetical protein [Gluconobacter sphaericus]QQX92636.1 hypothetical protein IGS75_13820 [Gluconobacter sphaericus]
MPARTDLRGHGVWLIDRADRYGDFVTVHVFRFENGLLTVRQVNRAQPALIRLVGRRVQNELTGCLGGLGGLGLDLKIDAVGEKLALAERHNKSRHVGLQKWKKPPRRGRP